jgi:hypothetical protein
MQFSPGDHFFIQRLAELAVEGLDAQLRGRVEILLASGVYTDELIKNYERECRGDQHAIKERAGRIVAAIRHEICLGVSVNTEIQEEIQLKPAEENKVEFRKFL